MSRSIEVYELPFISSGELGDVGLSLWGRTAVLFYDYIHDEKILRSGIRIKGVVASKHRTENCCTSFQIRGYDRLVEVHGSPWVKKQLSEINDFCRKDYKKIRHFLIYFDGAGVAYEFLALDFEILPEESGTWESLRNVIPF